MTLWLPTLLSTITCVLNIQMGHVNPFYTFYVPRSFQWYKELFNPMSFDPCNFFQKIHEFIGILTFKMGAHLEMCEFILSHLRTLPGAWNVTPELHSWLALLQTLVLVVNRKLKSRQHTYLIIYLLIVKYLISVYLKH